MVETIKQMDNARLEQLLEEYPWFTLARREVYQRQDRETRRAGILLYGVKLKDDPVTKPKKQEPAKNSYYVVGGDYFSKSDFEELEKNGQAVNVSFNPISSTVNTLNLPETASSDNKEWLDQGEILTETLAGIYLEQEFYQRAIDVYEKLILLYPEKIAYFASLIENIKKNIN